MTEIDALIELQLRVMEQDDTIDKLNAELATQQKLLADMQLQLKALQARLDEELNQPAGNDLLSEPPPPHY